jgi:hypothetical protein
MFVEGVPLDHLSHSVLPILYPTLRQQTHGALHRPEESRTAALNDRIQEYWIPFAVFFRCLQFHVVDTVPALRRDLGPPRLIILVRGDDHRERAADTALSKVRTDFVHMTGPCAEGGITLGLFQPNTPVAEIAMTDVHGDEWGDSHARPEPEDVSDDVVSHALQTLVPMDMSHDVSPCGCVVVFVFVGLREA